MEIDQPPRCKEHMNMPLTNEVLENLCNKLCNEPKIRFCGVINPLGRLVIGGFRDGIKPLDNEDQRQMLYMQSYLEMSMKGEFDDTLGNVNFITTYRDNLVRGSEEKDLYIDIEDWKDQYDKGKRVELILINKKRLPEYYAARSIVFFSEKLKLPTDIRIFNEMGDLLEWYRYRDIRFNTDLKPSDFKPLEEKVT